MKRALLVVLAVLIGMSLVTTVFAATKTKSVTLTGNVVSNDGKQMTVKGPKAEQNFDVSGVKNADKYNVGDQVVIGYTEKDGVLMAASIRKAIIKGKTEKKTTTDTTETPSAK